MSWRALHTITDFEWDWLATAQPVQLAAKQRRNMSVSTATTDQTVRLRSWRLEVDWAVCHVDQPIIHCNSLNVTQQMLSQVSLRHQDWNNREFLWVVSIEKKACADDSCLHGSQSTSFHPDVLLEDEQLRPALSIVRCQRLVNGPQMLTPRGCCPDEFRFVCV